MPNDFGTKLYCFACAESPEKRRSAKLACRVGGGGLVAVKEVLQRRAVGVVSGFRFLRRDAARDEEAVEPLAHGPRDIGLDPVANGENALVGYRNAQLGEPSAGEVVDRRGGFAEIEGFPTHLLVHPRDGPGAPLALVAPVDDDVGVEAEKGQATRLRRQQDRPPCFGLGLRVFRSGTEDAFGLFQADGLDFNRILDDMDRLENHPVAVLTHEVDLFADRAGEESDPRGIARGGDRVPRIARHAETVELCLDGPSWARGIGQENDVATAGAVSLQRGHGRPEGRDAVVHDAPDIAEKRVVVRRDLGEAVDDAGAHRESPSGRKKASENHRHPVGMPAGASAVFRPVHQSVRFGMICFFLETTPGRTTVSPSTLVSKLFSARSFTSSFGTRSVASSFRMSMTKSTTCSTPSSSATLSIASKRLSLRSSTMAGEVVSRTEMRSFLPETSYSFESIRRSSASEKAEMSDFAANSSSA